MASPFLAVLEARLSHACRPHVKRAKGDGTSPRNDAGPGRSAGSCRPLDRLAPRGQVPGVRCALLLAVPRVLDELQARQAPQQLRDLALVGDARALGDLAVARTRRVGD